MAKRVKMLRTKEYSDKTYEGDSFHVLEDAVADYLIKNGDAGFCEEVSDKLLENEKLTAKMAKEDAQHAEKAEKAESLKTPKAPKKTRKARTKKGASKSDDKDKGNTEKVA